MSDVIIQAHGLGKQYRLGAYRPAQTFREHLSSLVRTPFRSRRGKAETRNGQRDRDFWALKDVSFEISRGDVLAIIGRNGAGKSTLLKILSRITEPTEGEADLHGRVGSLLEIGTGFHGELSGRENIFLNGAILGMKRAEIARKLDEIVAFAELADFLDTPVKHYSSGMYMRLAFAVAAHLDPEILIVDEVLAVGDAEFQKKCLGKMGDVARGGRTVLFVSHNMAVVQKLCNRALLLEKGRVRLVGSISDAVRVYLESAQHFDGRLNLRGRRFTPQKVEILDAWMEREGVATGSFQFGECADVFLRLGIRVRTAFSVELLLRQQEGVPVAFAPSGLAQGWEIDLPPGEVTVRCRLPAAQLASGHYAIDLITALSGTQFLDYIESGLGFEIAGGAIGERNWSFGQNAGKGHALWDVRFEMATAPLAQTSIVGF